MKRAMDAEQASQMALAAREGMALPAEMHAQVSDDFLAAFGTEAGARALAHLKRITTGRVLGPEDSDAALRDLEGRRALVALIEMRMTDARRRRERAAGERRDAGRG